MTGLNFRKATIDDADLYYKWSNDPLVRENSFQQEVIPYQSHLKWFKQKIETEVCQFYLFLNLEDTPVGQVRIDKVNNETIIGLSIDAHFRGKGLGAIMLDMACLDYLGKNPNETVVAYIKEENISSNKIFEKAGFNSLTKVLINENLTNRLTRVI